MRVEIFDRMEQCTEQEVQRMIPLVSAQRREQAMRYKHTLGQFCCLKSWLMLKELLGQVGFNRIDSDEFRYNPNGKPYIPGAPHFSISHCKAGIAVAVDEKPIGIDIEAIRHADEELIKRTMNEAERELVNEGMSELERDRAFIRLWTQKEAVVKMQGTGITSFEQVQKILEIGDWKLETIEKENYIYSIAYE